MMRAFRNFLATVTIVIVAGMGLAACSSGSPTPAGATQGAGHGQGSQGFGTGQRAPGAVGLVAAIAGDTAQVQSATSQTAVTWTSTTTFTDEVGASASEVQVGSCVIARPAIASGANSPTTGPLAAATIEIFAKADGGCTAGLTGRVGTGAPGGGFNTQRPSQPSATPSAGSSSGARRGGVGSFGAVGTVTAIGSGTLTLSVQRLSGGASPSPTAGTSSDEVVTWSTATTFTQLKKATSSAVTVGVCANAQGSTDQTGALTARSIAVSQPTDGTCPTGFGRGQSASGSANG